MNEPTIRKRAPDAVMLTIGQTLAAVMRMVAWDDVSQEARDQCAPLPPELASVLAGQSPKATEARIRITDDAGYLTWLIIDHLDSVQAVKLACVNPTGSGNNLIAFGVPQPGPGLWIHTNDGEPGFSEPSYNGTAPSFLTRNMFGHVMDWLGLELTKVDDIELLVQVQVGGKSYNLTADSRRGGWPNVRPQAEQPTD